MGSWHSRRTSDKEEGSLNSVQTLVDDNVSILVPSLGQMHTNVKMLTTGKTESGVYGNSLCYFHVSVNLKSILK